MLAKTMTVKQRLWLSHVKTADESEGSIADYALAQGLRLKTLYQWKSKLVRLGLYRPESQADHTNFTPVGTVQSPPTLPGCTIKLPNGTVIELAGELDTKTIRSIIASAGLKR